MSDEIRFLNVQEVLFIHERMIEQYGGAAGTLNPTGLLSAVARPQQYVFGQETHVRLVRKAAALLESLARNHPFIDGNKRTAYAAVGQFLRLNGLILGADADGAERFVLGVVAGEFDLDQIESWIVQHVIEIVPEA